MQESGVIFCMVCYLLWQQIQGGVYIMELTQYSKHPHLRTYFFQGQSSYINCNVLELQMSKMIPKMVPNPLDCSFMRVFTALYIGYYHLLPGCYRGMSYAVSIAYPDSMSSSVSAFGHQTSFRVKKICFFFWFAVCIFRWDCYSDDFLENTNTLHPYQLLEIKLIILPQFPSYCIIFICAVEIFWQYIIDQRVQSLFNLVSQVCARYLANLICPLSQSMFQWNCKAHKKFSSNFKKLIPLAMLLPPSLFGSKHSQLLFNSCTETFHPRTLIHAKRHRTHFTLVLQGFKGSKRFYVHSAKLFFPKNCKLYMPKIF